MKKDRRLGAVLFAAFIFWGTVGSALLLVIRPREPLVLLVLGWPIPVVVIGGAVVTLLAVLGGIGWTLPARGPRDPDRRD